MRCRLWAALYKPAVYCIALSGRYNGCSYHEGNLEASSSFELSIRKALMKRDESRRKYATLAL
jgi:hypothetical protein